MLKNSMSRGNLHFRGDRALKGQKNAITGHSRAIRLPQINVGTKGRKPRTTLSLNFQEVNQLKLCIAKSTEVFIDPSLIDKVEYYWQKVGGRTARGK